MHVPQICLHVVFPTFVRAGWCCGETRASTEGAAVAAWEPDAWLPCGEGPRNLRKTLGRMFTGTSCHFTSR